MLKLTCYVADHLEGRGLLFNLKTAFVKLLDLFVVVIVMPL